MRAGILVLGPLLAKFGTAKVSLPGGCAIGTRPVDIHLDALSKLGVKYKIIQGYVHATAPKGLIGKKTKIKDDTDFVQKLLEKQNVAVVQGSAFGLDGYFRISYATSMQKLKVAMARIKLFCESLG